MAAKNLQAFGKTAVITIEPITIDPSKDNLCAKELRHRTKPFYTANIELAPVVSGKSDHRLKVIFQPTITELPLLTCVFMGFLPAYRMVRGDKWIVFLRQKENGCIFIKAALTNMIVMPLKAGDLYLFTDVLLNRLSQTSYSDPDLILMNLRNIAAIYQQEAEKILQSNTPR